MSQVLLALVPRVAYTRGCCPRLRGYFCTKSHLQLKILPVVQLQIGVLVYRRRHYYNMTYQLPHLYPFVLLLTLLKNDNRA